MHVVNTSRRSRYLGASKLLQWTSQESNDIHFALATRLEVTFQAYWKGKAIDIGNLVCEHGKAKPTRYKLSDRLTGREVKPEIKHDLHMGTAHIEGMFATMGSGGKWIRELVEKVTETISGEEIPDSLFADRLGMTLKYWPDKDNMPQLVTEFQYPQGKR